MEKEKKKKKNHLDQTNLKFIEYGLNKSLKAFHNFKILHVRYHIWAEVLMTSVDSKYLQRIFSAGTEILHHISERTSRDFHRSEIVTAR